jgi:hypothetical protein
VQSTYSLLIVNLIYRMWHRTLRDVVVNWDLEVLHGHGFWSMTSLLFLLTTYSTLVSTTSPLMELNGRRWRIKIGGDLISYILKLSAYLGSLFLWPRFPLHTCARGWSFFHCDQQLVVVRVLVERGLASLMIQWYLLEGHGAKQES